MHRPSAARLFWASFSSPSPAAAGRGTRELRAPSTSSLPGAKVFASAGCGGCHTLAGREVEGNGRPEPRPAAAGRSRRVERQVRNGGVGMPSFCEEAERDRDQPGRGVRLRVHAQLDHGRLRRRRLQAGRHEDRGLQGVRLPLLRAGLREHLLQRRPEGGARQVRPGHQDAGPDRARLPPDRARDRRRRALTLPRQRRPGVRRRPPELHVGLLPRHPRARVPRSRPEQARRRGAEVLRRPEDPEDRVHRLPVRPRPRARADDLHGLRPARSRCTPATSSRKATQLSCTRRRLHGELPVLVRRQVALAQGRRT